MTLKSSSATMKSLMIVNEKGGVGKTTLAINLAQHFAKAGKKVAVLDIDAQRNTTKVFSDYSTGIFTSSFFFDEKHSFSPPTEEITLYPADRKLILVDSGEIKLSVASKNFQNAITSLSKQDYDICVIDSPGMFGTRLFSAMYAVQYVLAPIEVEAFSIDGIKDLLTNIKKARDQRGNVQLLGIVANKVDKRSPRQVQNINDLNKAYPGFLMPVMIGNRSSIPESIAKKEPIWRNQKTSASLAKKELAELAALVMQKMEIH